MLWKNIRRQVVGLHPDNVEVITSTWPWFKLIICRASGCNWCCGTHPIVWWGHHGSSQGTVSYLVCAMADWVSPLSNNQEDLKQASNGGVHWPRKRGGRGEQGHNAASHQAVLLEGDQIHDCYRVHIATTSHHYLLVKSRHCSGVMDDISNYSGRNPKVRVSCPPALNIQVHLSKWSRLNPAEYMHDMLEEMQWESLNLD